MIRTLLLPLLAGLSLLSMIWHVGSTQKPPADAQPPTPPARSVFSGGVAASGIVEPASENVHLSTEVPGVVAEVLVAEGEAVSRGAVVFRLDDRWKQSELAVQRAVLAASEQDLERLRSLPRGDPRKRHAETSCGITHARIATGVASERWQRCCIPLVLHTRHTQTRALHTSARDK